MLVPAPHAPRKSETNGRLCIAATVVTITPTTQPPPDGSARRLCAPIEVGWSVGWDRIVFRAAGTAGAV